jgi:hypothetical protein
MIEDTKHVEFADVEVLDYGGPVMCCRVGDRVVWVPALRVLPGTEIKKQGDTGRLVLPTALAVDLGLAGRFARSFSQDQPPASGQEERIVAGVEDGAHAHRWVFPATGAGATGTVSNDLAAGLHHLISQARQRPLRTGGNAHRAQDVGEVGPA